MKKVILILCVLVAACVVLAEGVHFRFVNAPLDLVLKEYSKLTGKSVEVVKGVHGTLTFETETDLAIDQAAGRLEEELNKENIGLFPITTNRMVATWIDPAKAKPSPKRMSYKERLRRRREALKKKRETSSNRPAQDDSQ